MAPQKAAADAAVSDQQPMSIGAHVDLFGACPAPMKKAPHVRPRH